MKLSTYLNNIGAVVHMIEENDIAVITGTEQQIRKIIRDDMLEIKEIYTPRFPRGAWKVFTKAPKVEVVTVEYDDLDQAFFG
jgi:hypothetical protein